MVFTWVVRIYNMVKESLRYVFYVALLIMTIFMLLSFFIPSPNVKQPNLSFNKYGGCLLIAPS